MRHIPRVAVRFSVRPRETADRRHHDSPPLSGFEKYGGTTVFVRLTRWRRLGWREHRQGDRWQAWDLDDRRTRRVVAEGADGGGGVLVVGGALAAGDVLGAVAGAGLAVDAGVGLPSTPARESVREVHCFGDLHRVWAAQSTGMSVG